MKILMLAPHPFFQERGTPIAVNLLLQTLSEFGKKIDLFTFHEGTNVYHENVRIFRTPNLVWLTNIRPGFSWKKIVCDFFMFFQVLSKVRKNKYDVIHAVEEAAFIAIVIKKLFGIPYIYDMDSSLAQQMVEKLPFLKLFSPIFEFFENKAIKESIAVVAVCDALANVVKKHDKEKKVALLYDVSLVNNKNSNGRAGLRQELGITGILTMYIGNLEVYQGIDLLLEGFQVALNEKENEIGYLVIIGGLESDIRKYKTKAGALGIAERVFFTGPKSFEYIGEYMDEADILVSPRIKGQNTPMKIYSYLNSGKAILATDIYSHTQVLDEGNAVLTSPSPEPFARAMLQLVDNRSLRKKLGDEAKRLVEEKYSYSTYKNTLDDLYKYVETSAIRN